MNIDFDFSELREVEQRLADDAPGRVLSCPCGARMFVPADGRAARGHRFPAEEAFARLHGRHVA